jgi:hypothetical protein
MPLSEINHTLDSAREDLQATVLPARQGVVYADELLGALGTMDKMISDLPFGITDDRLQRAAERASQVQDLSSAALDKIQTAVGHIDDPHARDATRYTAIMTAAMGSGFWEDGEPAAQARVSQINADLIFLQGLAQSMREKIEEMGGTVANLIGTLGTMAGCGLPDGAHSHLLQRWNAGSDKGLAHDAMAEIDAYQQNPY